MKLFNPPKYSNSDKLILVLFHLKFLIILEFIFILNDAPQYSI